MRTAKALLVVAALASFVCSQALAYHLTGYVFCDVNLNGEIDEADTPLPGVEVMVVEIGGGDDGVVGTATTDADGYYHFLLGYQEAPGKSFLVTLDTATLPSSPVILIPEGGQYILDVIEGVRGYTLRTGIAWDCS